jgi:nitroreductase
LNFEAERFLRAPIVIAVVSRVREGKNPLWEQILSAGAAAQNLCLAANALGFGTCWVTEWYSYSEAFRKSLGLDERDNIAGFVYIGTPSQLPEERDRPDPARVITFWSPDTKLNNGTGYGQDGMGLPRKGFTF